MAYQLYRTSTLGQTLQETLDEMIQLGQMTPALAVKVLQQYDKVINTALESRVKSRLNFKAGHLETYRFCDNVWTFILREVEFKDSQSHGHAQQEPLKVDKVKIVACDGKGLASGVGPGV